MAPETTDRRNLSKESNATLNNLSTTGTSMNNGASSSLVVPMDIDGDATQDKQEASSSVTACLDEAGESTPSNGMAIRGEAHESTLTKTNNANSNPTVPYGNYIKDNISDTNYTNHTISKTNLEFVSTISSDKRLKLNNEIDRLKMAVFKATITNSWKQQRKPTI
ncbi:hypothetical protein [Parasitella parasitica]|uniref:Uncharacterized protein n=1 Tax=Parasitella parasitica TaxID=35722 RepID=A0A0B7NN74_9FUNG|nr:hypothetical protein [Parasitella parasitica]